MAVELRKAGDVEVLEFHGKITRGTGDVEMRERFARALEGGGSRFLFDLREVPFMDSAAIGEMVACLKRARQRDARLKVLLVRNGRPVELLRLASLDRVFDVFYDESSAVESFRD